MLLHITGDYPDPEREATTEAVKRLIDRLTSFDHVIFSLSRFADPRRTYMIECPPPAGNQRLFAFGHFGLPLGIGLRSAFTSVARHIEAVLDECGIEPDLIHSHRLTFDGIAGNIISRRRRLPHIVSVRGEVESKVVRAKPNYRVLVQRIASEADVVLYVSAWFRPTLERIAPLAIETGRTFPNIIANVSPAIAPRPAVDRFVTAARLDAWRVKGIDQLIRALARARPRLGTTGLDIYGTGSARSIEFLQRMVDRHGLGDLIEFKGRVTNAEFLERLPHYLGMVLPSSNETFGMVYTEALFAGVPILYGRGSGIDGFLDGLDVGVAVDPSDVGDITAGLVSLAQNRERLRDAIAAAGADLASRFDPDRHIAAYEADVRRLLS